MPNARSPGTRVVVTFLSSSVDAMVAAVSGVLALAGAGGVAPGPARHPTVHLRAAVPLHAQADGPVVGMLGARSRFGSPTVLPVVARRPGWMQVLTPSRPDPGTAWIRTSRRVRLGSTSVSVTADLSSSRLTVHGVRGGPRHFLVRGGSRSTPTPLGRFGVTDRLAGAAFGGAYGCCILALSGHQPRVPDGWGGGTRLAIHGRPGGGRPTPSTGCLVLSGPALRWMTRHVPLGVIVSVRE